MPIHMHTHSKHVQNIYVECKNIINGVQAPRTMFHYTEKVIAIFGYALAHIVTNVFKCVLPRNWLPYLKDLKWKPYTICSPICSVSSIWAVQNELNYIMLNLIFHQHWQVRYKICLFECWLADAAWHDSHFNGLPKKKIKPDFNLNFFIAHIQWGTKCGFEPAEKPLRIFDWCFIFWPVTKDMPQMFNVPYWSYTPNIYVYLNWYLSVYFLRLFSTIKVILLFYSAFNWTYD